MTSLPSIEIRLAGVVSREKAIEAGRVTWGRFEREATPEEWAKLTPQQRKVAAELRWTDEGYYVLGGNWKTSASLREIADESIDSLRAAYDDVLDRVAKEAAARVADALEAAGFGAVYTLVEGSEEYRKTGWDQRKSPTAESLSMLASVEKAAAGILEEFVGIEVHDVLRIDPHEGEPFTGTVVTITSPGCNDRVVVVSFEA